MEISTGFASGIHGLRTDPDMSCRILQDAMNTNRFCEGTPFKTITKAIRHRMACPVAPISETRASFTDFYFVG